LRRLRPPQVRRPARPQLHLGQRLRQTQRLTWALFGLRLLDRLLRRTPKAEPGPYDGFWSDVADRAEGFDDLELRLFHEVNLSYPHMWDDPRPYPYNYRLLRPVPDCGHPPISSS
jgi:hypothetical protein